MPGGTCSCPSGLKQCGGGGACVSCCATSDCPSGQVCPPGGGSCSTCPGGQIYCGGTCVTGTCCPSGANTCPNNQTCQSSNTCGCSATLPINCNGTCYVAGSCCDSTTCSGGQQCQSSHTCACPSGTKNCGTSCAACCGSGDCTSPPDKCHNTAGTCSGGACSYTTVSCTTADCHTTAACDPASGNCTSTNLPDGTSCGAAGGCHMIGKCTGGNCSGTAKDCTMNIPACKVGVCDSMSGNCNQQNAVNGISCQTDDKCVMNALCQGGACVGAAVACPAPTTLCRVAGCDPATGCKEVSAPVGSICPVTDPCSQSGICDATGKCIGIAAPDGTPCALTQCPQTSVCTTGVCGCGAPLTALDAAAPETPDLSIAGQSGAAPKSGGCSFSPTPGAPVGSLMLVVLLLLISLKMRLKAMPFT